MSDTKTYIVTGGAGFVGSNLCAALAKREAGCHLIVIDDLSLGSVANLVEAFARQGLPPFNGEVIARPFWDVPWGELLGGVGGIKGGVGGGVEGDGRVGAVFHEAAITDTTVMDEPLMMRVNAEKSEMLMRACAERRVPLVYASSAATYGTPAQARERRPFPLSAAGSPSNVYGFSKWIMERNHERVARDFAAARRGESGGVPWIVGLRYFNVFGPGESRKGKMASMVYQLAQQMLRGERPRVFVDGSQARDQVHVDDVVGCTLAAAGLGVGTGEKATAPRDPEPGVYNVGSGVTTSFNQIVAALRVGLKISEAERPTEYFEMPASVRAFYQDYTCADVSQTRAGLGWSPAFKPELVIAEYAKRMLEELKA